MLQGYKRKLLKKKRKTHCFRLSERNQNNVHFETDLIVSDFSFQLKKIKREKTEEKNWLFFVFLF
jgi:hypothetical protein